MACGLQIWDKTSGGMIVDLTTQFTNIIGFVDVPFPPVINGQFDWSVWNHIFVPEFSLGIPFWFVSHNWHVNHPDWLENLPAWNYPDMFDVAPDMYVNDNVLYYKYTLLSNIPMGDQTAWIWGGHRLWYGVN